MTLSQFRDRLSLACACRALLGMLFLAIVFVCGSLRDAHAADLKIGYVNQERILRESAPGKRAQAKLEKEFGTRRAELERVEKQARDLEATLQKEAVTLTEADRVAKERQLAQLTRDFQRLQREFREDLNLRRYEEQVALSERANKVISDIAEKEKFDLILHEAVLHASNKVDITDKIIKALADK